LFLGTVIIGTIYTILDNFFGVSIDWLLTVGVIFLIAFVGFSIISFLFLRKWKRYYFIKLTHSS
jgi:hypothetical protein